LNSFVEPLWVRLCSAQHTTKFIQHPDKNKSKEATSKFQALSLAHSILSDPEKRSAYDASGSVDHADNATDLAAWGEYWRALFPAVTTNKIETFSSEYKGALEERLHVLTGAQDNATSTVLPFHNPV
jgi:DnaJ family protein C protein 9